VLADTMTISSIKFGGLKLAVGGINSSGLPEPALGAAGSKPSP
jgi:hypothetical protein